MMDELLQEMIDPAPQRGDVSRWRRLGATAAIFALAGLGITSLTTSALFTDRETTAGDLLTGTVDLSTAGTFEFVLKDGGAAPGDTYDAEVTIANSGSLQLRYAVLFNAEPKAGTLPDPTLDGDVGTGSGDLRDVVSLAVFPKPEATACAAATAPTPGTPHNGAVATVNTGATPGTYLPLLGDATQGPHDFDRALVATGSDTLCVRVVVDLDETDNAFQNTGLDLNLRFDAEQVVNNEATPAPPTEE